MKKPPKYPKQDNPRAKQRQLKAEWDALLARHASPLEGGAKARGLKVRAKKVAVKAPEDTRASNPTSMMGLTPKAEPKVYTGTAMVGIATMHKSNIVPIFNDEAAKDVARMRRG